MNRRQAAERNKKLLIDYQQTSKQSPKLSRTAICRQLAGIYLLSASYVLRLTGGFGGTKILKAKMKRNARIVREYDALTKSNPNWKKYSILGVIASRHNLTVAAIYYILRQ